MTATHFPFCTTRLFGLALLGALYSASAGALEDPTLAALALADNTEVAAVEDKRLNVMVEVAGLLNENAGNMQRVSLDIRRDIPLAQDWRLLLSGRFDSSFSHRMSQNRNVISLREGYLSYWLTPRTLIDAGRVNTRYGMALGYNPTDFLGRGTVRSVISADPETLRNNRLGNAMVRLQHFRDRAAVTAIWSPKISDSAGDSSASPDWRASNPRGRLLLTGSYRFAENLNPQLSLLLEEHRSPQTGFSLSRVISRSTLIYGEWAGGRQPFSWQTAFPGSQRGITWRHRAAAGITLTGENHLTLRLEGHYNGSADNRRALSFLSSIPPYAVTRDSSLSGDRTTQQTLDWMTPRRSALVQVYWKDVIDQYDLNLIWQRDLQRQKNMGFAELRHHLGEVDLALQWQKVYRLETERAYRIRPDRRWQLSVSYYF